MMLSSYIRRFAEPKRNAKKTTLKKVVFKVCLEGNRDYLQPHFADTPIPSNLQFLSQAAQTHAESKLP